MLEDGLRSAVDQVLGFFETKVGKGTDLFDDLDLLVTSTGENDVEFVLLGSSFAATAAACSRGCSNSYRSSCGNAELLFEVLE